MEINASSEHIIIQHGHARSTVACDAGATRGEKLLEVQVSWYLESIFEAGGSQLVDVQRMVAMAQQRLGKMRLGVGTTFVFEYIASKSSVLDLHIIIIQLYTYVDPKPAMHTHLTCVIQMKLNGTKNTITTINIKHDN